MSSTAISPRLENLFVRRLDKLTDRKRDSLYRQIEKTLDPAEKRIVFDDGLRDWAELLVKCAAEHVDLYRPHTGKRKARDRQIAAESSVLSGLFAFLGVDVTFEPERWPEANRVQTFTRNVCFCGSLLPAWFDVGFLSAAKLIPAYGQAPPTHMGEDLSVQHMCDVYRRFSGIVLDELLDAFDRQLISEAGLIGDSKSARRGRLAGRPQEFTALACELWLAARNALPTQTRVSDGQLSEIARKLDERGYGPPSEYLEGKCASDLKAYNSKNSASKPGPIKTWEKLVLHGDKDHVRGMRRLLSRCAKTAESS